jgi:hypothetical protein
LKVPKGIGISKNQSSGYQNSHGQEVREIHSENPDTIRTIHPLGMHVRNLKKFRDQHFMSPGDKEDLHFGIAKSNFLKKGELCVGPC